jgi:uncharacterized RmlC-like cupin family protein
VTSTETTKWRTDGVTIVRGGSLQSAMAGTGRATAYNFSGAGGQRTWVGTVTMAPGAKTGVHHHGRHEVAIYVVRGRSRIRWGERLEFMADIGPGDFAYFTPFAPHQEANLDDDAPLDFVVVRSDNEGIAVRLDVEPVEQPEPVF